MTPAAVVSSPPTRDKLMLEMSRSMIETFGGTTLNSKPFTAHELTVAISNGFAGRGEGKPADIAPEGHQTATSGVAEGFT